MTTSERYQRFLQERHRPSHARRTAAAWAGFFLTHLKPGDRVLDLGCGPGSITAGLGDAVGEDATVVGVDLSPGSPGVPTVAGDIHRLPFPDASFDAVFSCAVLQHVADPLAVLLEARRVSRPGAVIGVADADWTSALRLPADRWLDRGQEVQEQLRAGTSPFVGGRLRGLLHEAGFEDATAVAHGRGGGNATATPFEAEFQATFFDAQDVVAHVVALGIATAEEMAEIAAAYRRWGQDPGAVSAGHWFEATARAPA